MTPEIPCQWETVSVSGEETWLYGQEKLSLDFFLHTWQMKILDKHDVAMTKAKWKKTSLLCILFFFSSFMQSWNQAKTGQISDYSLTTCKLSFRAIWSLNWNMCKLIMWFLALTWFLPLTWFVKCMLAWSEMLCNTGVECIFVSHLPGWGPSSPWSSSTCP